MADPALRPGGWKHAPVAPTEAGPDPGSARRERALERTPPPVGRERPRPGGCARPAWGLVATVHSRPGVAARRGPGQCVCVSHHAGWAAEPRMCPEILDSSTGYRIILQVFLGQFSRGFRFPKRPLASKWSLFGASSGSEELRFFGLMLTVTATPGIVMGWVGNCKDTLQNWTPPSGCPLRAFSSATTAPGSPAAPAPRSPAGGWFPSASAGQCRCHRPGAPAPLGRRHRTPSWCPGFCPGSGSPLPATPV